MSSLIIWAFDDMQWQTFDIGFYSGKYFTEIQILQSKIIILYS